MSEQQLLSSDQFATLRPELPEQGRWTELIAGEVINYQPPSDLHGTVVLNLTKEIGNVVMQTQCGYACYDLGLIVKEKPATVLFPSVAFFTGTMSFEQTDELVTRKVPQLVIDVASTNDRRKQLAHRIKSLQSYDVKLLWIIDPDAKEIHCFTDGLANQTLTESDTLKGHGTLPGFEMPVAAVFELPSWWK